ncbi:hypothetical protein FRC14_001892 [Serendipita sp. 396]|nr:hypothetical protein FRC14_001892 [Serendipita sp. 396]
MTFQIAPHIIRGTFGPIYTLPIELLAYVFVLALNGTRMRQTVVVTLRSVCKSWYSITEGSPIFWRSVHIRIDPNIRTNREESLKARLLRHSNVPIEVEIYVGGASAHGEMCKCKFERGWCDVLRQYRRSLLQFLRILVGKNGIHMSRWTSFKLDQYTEWDFPNALVHNQTDFAKVLNYPTPLLERLEVWGVFSKNPMFPITPRLHTIWFQKTSCIFRGFSNVRRLRIEKIEDNNIPWELFQDVEELTIQIPDEEFGAAPQSIVFNRLRRLALLGSAPYELLEAIKEIPLDFLVVRVWDAMYLERVIERLPLRDTTEIIIGGYSRLIKFRARPYAATSAEEASNLVAFVEKARGLPNVKILGQDLVEQLNGYGINTQGIPCYARNEADDPLNDMYSWKEEESWDTIWNDLEDK